MNSAAAKTSLPYSMAVTNGQYNGDQAGMDVTGEEQNASFFSGSNPIQCQLFADSFLDSIMVNELVNSDCYSNEAPPQPLPTTYPPTLQTEYQYNMPLQQHYVYHPSLIPLPASGSVPNPNMGSINNNVASLMPSDGNPDKTINFEHLLVDFRILNQVPRNPSTHVGNALTALPMHAHGYNQGIQIQGQQFLPQTHIPGFANNASDGITQIPNRRRRLDPVEALHHKRQKMIKNRDSAARSRARKLARNTEMQNELVRLREENDKLKKMLDEATETKNGDKNPMTNSWS